MCCLRLLYLKEKKFQRNYSPKLTGIKTLKLREKIKIKRIDLCNSFYQK